jgi:hypothetical protein
MVWGNGHHLKLYSECWTAFLFVCLRGGLDDLSDRSPACWTVGIANVNHHGAAFEYGAGASCPGSGFYRKETVFDRSFPLKKGAFDLIVDELQVDGFERSEQVLPESVDAVQILLIAESFDHLGVVVCQDSRDVATCERRSDRVAGLFERLPLLGRTEVLLVGDWRLAAGGRQQDAGRSVADGREQVPPVHRASYIRIPKVTRGPFDDHF